MSKSTDTWQVTTSGGDRGRLTAERHTALLDKVDELYAELQVRQQQTENRQTENRQAQPPEKEEEQPKGKRQPKRAAKPTALKQAA